MDNREYAHMRKKFRRGLVWIALGAALVVAVECVWDAVMANRQDSTADGRTTFDKESWCNEESGLGDMVAFVLGGKSEVDSAPVSRVFIDECFDPYAMGEVSASAEGGVVGVVSDRDADELFRACAHGLDGGGWIRVESGQAHRCTFLKNTGSLRWLFLDVTQVGDSGVAVIVTEEGA